MSAETETVTRIRWERRDEHDERGKFERIAGRIGKIDTDLFALYPPYNQNERWLLVSFMPGLGSEFTYGDGEDELKQRADGRLEEFAAALGAIFPAAPLPARDAHHHLDLTCGACGEEFGTNCADDDIRCAVCSAHRCPHCGGWFGED